MISGRVGVGAGPLLVELTAGPTEEFAFFAHPSGHGRIVTATRWKAENLP